MKVNLSCTIRGKERSDDMDPTGNPHTLPDKQALSLIGAGLAVEVVGSGKNVAEVQETAEDRFDNTNVDKKNSGSRK